jgi:hypothetical protein
MPANNICFVIAPIGEPDSPIRKRSDQVFDYLIKPAAEECGFTALRADQIAQPGIITSQVIQHLIEDPMVVADLTGPNANVFYELAIRHAFRRPYVQIIEQDEQLPFDVFGIRSIRFTYRYIDSLNMARAEMVKQMNSLLSDGADVESPITTAVNLSTLKHSDKPIDRQFAEVLTAIAELKQQVGSLQRQATVPAPPADSSSYAPYVSLNLLRPPSSRMHGLPHGLPDVDDLGDSTDNPLEAARFRTDPIQPIKPK